MPYGKIIFDFSANFAHPLSVFLCFFPLDQLFDAHGREQHDVRCGGERDDVDDQAEGERNDALNDGVDG